MLSPPLKWAGGKRWLVLPPSTGRWIEPFAGSAAQFFTRLPAQAVLSDTNPHLINFYLQLQTDAASVVAQVPGRVSREEYVVLRAVHNTRRIGNNAARAAVFYTLNRTCFNGLWRENKEGEFNTPWCKDPGRVVLAHDLLEVGSALKRADLRCEDFASTCARALPGDTVYMDPPYFETFDAYRPGGFDAHDHLRVFACANNLRARGVRVWLSYNKHPQIERLYRHGGFTLQEVSAPRGIRGGRSSAPELLITSPEGP